MRILPRHFVPCRVAWGCLLLAAVWLGLGAPPSARAEIRVTKAGDSLVDERALTIQGGFGQAINGLSFQQDAVASHAGWQYVAYYDADRRVCLARRRLPKGAWQVIRFGDYHFASDDAHNTISLGICPSDGTLHLAFDHHVHPLHYRASRRGVASDPGAVTWEASLFGPVRGELEKGKPIRITYPRFWQTPEGGLQFCYRQGGSGNGDRMLVDYEPADGTWRGTRQIDSRAGTFRDALGTSPSRCSYPNGYTYGPGGLLHATWVWREDPQGANHDLMYAVSGDGGKTWRNNAGQPIEGPARLETPGITVVRIAQTLGLMNTHGQTVDSLGRVHVVMWHCTEDSLRQAGSEPGKHRWGPPAARRYHHYWRDEKGTWRHAELPGQAGTRPKVLADKHDNLLVLCGSAWSKDLFGAKGNLTIYAATARSLWQDWKVVHVEPGPFLNEMLADTGRWKTDGTLSTMVQQSPDNPRQPTPLRILDFNVSE